VNDIQLLTLALAVIVPLSLLLYSNGRITEAKETLRAEIADTKHSLQSEIADTKHSLQSEMAAGFARIEAAIERLETKLVIHELEHHAK
jgi:hypothetical protein